MTAPTRRSVSELVRVGLDDAINNDIEGWNALLCELTGEPLLQDIFWRIEGVEDQSIQLRVTGYVEVDENGRDAEGLNAFDREMDRKLARAFDDAGADPESIIVVSHNAGFGADSPVIEEGAMIYVRRPGEV
jgi:hypothetical protein